MQIVVAADNNWAIGKDGALLVNIPEDMQFFRKLTVGNVVVMGRKTLESFPGGRPLPDRINIVLTSQKDYDGRGAIVVHSKEELLEELKRYDRNKICVIGGESIYRMLLPYCDKAYVTKIDYSYDADTWMPNLDQMEGWEQVMESEECTFFSLIYHFTSYVNHNPEQF
ncbi:MAG: dihydrofolate reductase [Lachnospiraceae bacterium]|nr:dihydrofolate reductase [Lachnospiraceae bacterium]